MIGQAEQYMFCTVSVTVLSPANAADEAKRLRPKTAAVRDLIMRCSPFG
jgi:hypothetical protein